MSKEATTQFGKTKQNLKWFAIAIGVNIVASGVFYLSLLINSSNTNTADANIYEQSLSASISQFEYLPALLASDNLFINTLTDSPENQLLANKKLTFIAERAGADVAYIMNITGTVVTSSNHLSDNSFIGKNYAFRPYFKSAIEQKKRQFYYAKGATTGIPGFFISEPIISKQQVIGVAVVKLDMRFWEKNWQNSDSTIITADKNNVIILSSVNQWRYKTIGELSSSTLTRINQLQQFGNDQLHTSLYSDIHSIQLYHFFSVSFWKIDNELYLSQRSTIPDIDWTLYYLVKNQQFLYPTFIFFTITSAFILFAYLIRRERKHRIASINKNQKLELIRQEELKTVMDNIHVGVTLFTETGLLISINDHAKYLLFQGHAPSTDINIYINDIISIEAVQFDSLLLNDTSSATYHEAYALNEGQKTTPIMFALSKVSAMDTELYLMTFINIKRRKAAEDELVNINNSLEDTIAKRTQELQQAQTTLIQKNKAVALGNMAATIVHELSQPLSAINSSVSAVSAKIDKQDWSGAKESADRLHPLSKKMHNVINLLKHFSYQDNQDQKKTPLIIIVNNALNNVSDILNEKKIQLNDNDVKKLKSDRVIYVDANPLKVDLVISNILKNAMDAAEKTSNATITVKIENDEKQAFIHISDNGGGIDPTIMSKLFSPYFTTKEVGKGLGLGLSISYEIIQEYNGNISAKNIGDGMCFTIQLPCYIEHQS